MAMKIFLMQLVELVYCCVEGKEGLRGHHQENCQSPIYTSTSTSLIDQTTALCGLQKAVSKAH